MVTYARSSRKTACRSMYRPQTKPEWRESAHLQGAQKDRTACRFDLQRSTPGHWQSLLPPRAPDPETQLVGLSEIRLRNGDGGADHDGVGPRLADRRVARVRIRVLEVLASLKRAGAERMAV